MKLLRKAGDTSTILQVFIQDSSSVIGAGLTGLVFNSAGLTAYYHRDIDTTATVMTLVTMTVGSFTSLGFKEIDATNMPGWYQFCPPNAAMAAGAKSVGFHLKGATNMAPLPIEVQLVAGLDVEDANALGAARLDAAITSRMATYTQPTGFLAATFPSSVASPTNITAATGITVATNNDKTGYALSSAGVQAIWDALTSALTTVGSVGKKLADWVIGTAQTGDSYARLGTPAGASVSADVAAVKADSAAIKAVTNLLPNAGALTDLAAIKAKTDSLTYTVAGQVDANIQAVNDVTITGNGQPGTEWGP